MRSCVYHQQGSPLKCSVAPSTACIDCNSWDGIPDKEPVSLGFPDPAPSKPNAIYFVGQDATSPFRSPIINLAINSRDGYISIPFDPLSYEDVKEYASRWKEPRHIELHCHHVFGGDLLTEEFYSILPLGGCVLGEFCEAEDGVTFLCRRIGRVPYLVIRWQVPRSPSFFERVNFLLTAGMVSEWDAIPDYTPVGRGAALTLGGLKNIYAQKAQSL